ncbi:hypothetical protein N658DRAFT_517141 [Parathielavia hyrcaniae]|uniref:Uncharacterized protein n=1 Tax=Parathielavia hyrcaniae TaxID=113614 RepID=A0AAN6PX85_9PEZI|nr:hypothetical protein N658DRAFT_517141 [Parathielavia hyrcaniae]
MWDRLRTVPHHHASGRPVNHPLDDDRIRVGLGLGSGGLGAAKGYSYSIRGGPAPPRPPREFLESRYETPTALSNLETPRFKEPPPCNPRRITARTANLRPASAFCSKAPRQVPKYTANVATKSSYRYGGADEISPPSSPEPDARAADRFLPGDVSPIDEDDAPSHSRHAGIPNTDRPRNARPDPPFAPDPRRQSPPQHRGPTRIGSMRRERRRQSDAAARDGNPNQRGFPSQHAQHPPRREVSGWDPLTGEQTSSAHGRPPQLKPGDYAQGLGITSQSWASHQNIPSTAPPSFGDRVRRIAKKAAAARDGATDPAAGAFTTSRPGWRGASGRTAIVDPMHDTQEVPPLRIPEKSSRRNIPPAAASTSASNSTPDGPGRRGQTPPISPPPAETPTRSEPRDGTKRILPLAQPLAATHLPSQAGQRYPSPPLSGNSLAADAPAYGGSVHASSAMYAHSPDLGNQLRRKPPPLHTTPPQHQHQVSVSSVYSRQTDVPQPSPLQIPNTARPAVTFEEPYVQPPSRFSITTYATSNTGTTHDDLDDHQDDDQPPVPSLPASFQEQYGRPSSDHSPVTSPIDQFMTSPFPPPLNPTSRTPSTNPEHQPTQQQQQPPSSSTKPTNPALARTQALAGLDRPSSRASTSDMNKTLPLAPPEQSADQAHDRVGLLNAQLRALANRRINIHRSIAQMTELMPTDKLMNSAEVVRKREAEKKKVEALQQELAEVRREEYELGLKLHRAYKRLDREAEWEPTTLWVRRVTG